MCRTEAQQLVVLALVCWSGQVEVRNWEVWKGAWLLHEHCFMTWEFSVFPSLCVPLFLAAGVVVAAPLSCSPGAVAAPSALWIV